MLEHYHLIHREVKWQELVKLGGVIAIAIGIFVWVERHMDYELRQRDRLLVLLLTLSVPGARTDRTRITLHHLERPWFIVGKLLRPHFGVDSCPSAVADISY